MLVCCVAFQVGIADTYPSIKGHWEGKIDIPNTPLEIDIEFEMTDDGSLIGNISIPAQQVKDLLLAEINYSKDSVFFKLADMPGDPVFVGIISDDEEKISGDFSQGGQTFGFQLQRMDNRAARAKAALEGFEGFAEKAIKDWQVPGLAIAIVCDEEVVFTRGFGMRDIESELPVTTKTLFAIGSCTKAFTTFIMGILFDEGKIDWDSPVTEYIPEFRLYDPIATDLITSRDLVTHRSGLPRHDFTWYNNSKDTREDVVRHLRYLQPSAELREKYQYNNLMFLTAGYLVERVTDQTWEETVRESIFEPLGMNNSNFSVFESQKSGDYALPYEEENDQLVHIPFRQIDLIGPAGSINSNVEDMSKWLLVHLNNGKYKEEQLITPVSLADIHSPHMTMGVSQSRPEISQGSYGLGWVVDTYRGHLRIHHGGGIDGFTTQVVLFPNDNVGMVIIANVSGTGLLSALKNYAADLVLELEPTDWYDDILEKRRKGQEIREEAQAKKTIVRKKGTQPAHKLAEYMGEYEHPGYGLLAVNKVGKHLEFTFNNITTPLEHWHYEVFNAKKGADDAFKDMKIMFQDDMKGNVAAFEIALEPSVENIVFVKKPDARLFDAEYLKQFVGEYDLVGTNANISLAGNILNLNIPGSRQYTLVPDLGDEFVLKEASVVSIKFHLDNKGNVSSMAIFQPDAVYEAQKK
jgi:CubicO group peptidase (beta-lactamase class C family)